MRPGHALLWLVLALLGRPVVARAQADAAVPKGSVQLEHDAGSEQRARIDAGHAPAQLLEGYLTLLTERRLVPPPAQDVRELDALLVEARALVTSGRRDEALTILLDAVEGTRFRSFESLDSFVAAELALTKLLLEQGALSSAQRSVERLLARGVSTLGFGQAYRRAVDIALARGDYAASALVLDRIVGEPLPKDAANELAYLRALAAYERDERPAAKRELERIGNASRFYASARYLLGVIAAAQREFAPASAHFAAVRDLKVSAPVARLDTALLSPSQDAARLGLARVAHEQGRSKEAFDHYFGISADSPLLAEALFESAYASYERGEHELTLDALAQLEARYPASPYTAEARVLRGYAHLGRARFDLAERELVAFEATFGGLLRALDDIASSPSATRSLFVQRERDTPATQASVDPLLLGLVTRDPHVERLRRKLAQLDAELARSSRLDQTFAALAARVRGRDLPTGRASDDEAGDAARRTRLSQSLEQTRAALSALSRELRVLRRGGQKSDELTALEQSVRSLRTRSDKAERALRALRRASDARAEPPTSMELGARLDQEQRYAARALTRAEHVREQLETELARAEQRALASLRERLHKELRRARIGRIDAVMGKKRLRELEIESLAAGRFPAELTSRTKKPTLLRDDEEYWPFEGEDWPDDFEEQAR